jgi:hypothetical protein
MCNIQYLSTIPICFLPYFRLGKKAKKFERGLNHRTRTMMACFDIQDFSQLVDRASIYEEGLKESLAAATEHKKRNFILGATFSGDVELTREWL